LADTEIDHNDVSGDYRTIIQRKSKRGNISQQDVKNGVKHRGLRERERERDCDRDEKVRERERERGRERDRDEKVRERERGNVIEKRT